MPTDDPSTSSGSEDEDLLERFEATLPNQRELGERLLIRYREPHRRYHNVDHLRYVLTMIDELATDQDLFLVRLAAWFHDAIYDLPERELPNEEASARLAVRELSRAGLEQEDMTQVSRLVRLTATHVPGARDSEGELLCDADLAILAAEPAAYARYVEAVRAEYAAVPDEEFDAGRLAILVELAQRPLFRTGRGQSMIRPAEANLHAEVAAISERLGVPVEGSDA